MYKDPSEFRKRFKEYKEGKSVREIYGLPGYQDGLTTIELQIVDNQGVIRQGYPEIPIDKARAWSDKKYTGNSGETFVKNFANNLISTIQDAAEPYREALNLRLTPQGAFRILMDAGMSKAGQAVGKLISDAAKPVANAVSKSESVAHLTPSQMGRHIKENPQLVSNVNVDDAIKDAMWFHENLVLPAWESRGVHIGLDPKDFSIKQADFGDSKLGAIISEDGDIILNSKLPPERQAQIIEHEFGGHGAELQKRKIKKLYPKQASLINKWDAKDLFLVNQAYNYSDEFLIPRPGFPKAEESVVLNREVQYLISRDNGWAIGPELLLIIKLMPRARLRRYYAEANAYGKEIIKNAKDPDLMPQRTALMNVPVFGGGLYLANTDPNEYKNGKLPRYKIGKNPSHAKMNDDETFTDDYTKVFEDMYVTPEKVDLKRGSHTLNNFPKYLANRTAWILTFMPQAVLNDKPLERVYPEFDLLFGGRLMANEILPIKSSVKKEINWNDIREKAAQMKAEDDAFRVAHPEYEIENILKKPKLEDKFTIDELVKRANLEDKLTRAIFDKMLYENKDFHGRDIINLHNNRARLNGDFVDNVGLVFDVDTPEGYENAILFLKEEYFGTRDGAERLFKDPDFLSRLIGFSIPRGNNPILISRSKLILRLERDLGRKLTLQEADDLYYKTISHERHHSFDKIHNTPEGFNLEGLSPDDYFVKSGFDELAARGTLLKNMFGLYRKPLTGPHLRYAASLYFKDPSNINNNMTRFFNMITDYDKAAKWLLENATAIIPTAIGGSVLASIPLYKDGKIAIKPANRGKFNATKKRTGKTTEELTHSKNPLTRKRAIFAQNAKKWKH